MGNTTMMYTAVIISFVVTAALGIPLIPFLRRLKFGQTILDIGPSWHKSKQGTPTMGGLMFVIGILASLGVCGALLAGQSLPLPRLTAGVLMATAFAFLGFMDDYVKVVKKRNLGLTARQKYLIQLLITAAYLWTMYLVGESSTLVRIPFFGQIDLGVFYYLLSVIIITGFVNAVNLTDGIDGLASSCVFVYALVSLIISGMLQAPTATLLSSALAGGCMGFLVWNFYPAKVFMGDTGSMFLGGLVVALAYEVRFPLLILLSGVVFLGEAFSVILQVISFKSTGKRIFKMSPIHHHFEMCGWSEVKIVAVFSAVGLLGGILAILAVKMI